MTKISSVLAKLGACMEARNWAGSYGEDYQKAWQECERGDWMLWIIFRTIAKDIDSPERRRGVIACVACARLAPSIQKQECEYKRLECLEITEKWVNNDPSVSLAHLHNAADAAYDAAYADAYAAYAADDADAYAADAAAYAAYAAAYADDAAYAAAAAAAYPNKNKEILSLCANRVREIFPNPPTV